MATVYVQLFNSVKAELNSAVIDFLPDKRYQLLAYLAFEGAWVSRDRLAYLFWPDVATRTARHSLRQLLKRVKALAWLECLEAERERIRWVVSTDYGTFNAALEASDLLGTEVAYAGFFLKGLESGEASEFNNWLFHEREHLHGQWRRALLRQVDTLQAVSAAPMLLRLLEADALDEEALQVYMQVASQTGQASSAHRQYELFAKHLAEEMGLEPSSATQQLRNSIDVQKNQPAYPRVLKLQEFDALAAPSLPQATTSFVGRTKELKSIAHHMLELECRLLTLLGPGGMGKSRLALKAAHALAFEAGCYFVSLETLQHPADILHAIAEGLGVPLSGQAEPLQQLGNTIHDQQLLLILDNFEHLLEGAMLVSELLQACPKLSIIVTSRERLNLEQEWLLPVEGLDFPTETIMAAEALEYGAIKLFYERAKRVSLEFQLTTDNLLHLTKIAQFLEGSPLGLELAAARVRLMQPLEIAQELKQNLDVLDTTTRNVADRHKSLRATFEYSWKLLTQAEQRILQNLAVFQGGFRREAANLVTGASIAVLAALLDKSLLRVTPEDRFERHPLIFQYTQEKLVAQPKQLKDLQAKHAAYYLQLLKRWDEAFRGQSSSDFTVSSLSEDWQNIRSAWLYSSQETKHKPIFRNALALRNACLSLAKYQEAVDLFARASQSLSADSPEVQSTLGLCQVCEAWFHFRLGDFDTARGLAKLGLEVLNPLKESKGIIVGLNTLGSVAWRTGDYEKAQSNWHKGLALAEKTKDTEHIVAFSSNLGAAAEYIGELERAQRFYEKTLVMVRQLGNQTRLSSALNNLGALLMQLGAHDQAKALLLEGLELARQLALQQRLYVLLSNLTQLAFEEADFEQANAYAHEALELAQKASDKAHESSILNLLANLALAQRDTVNARYYVLKGLSIAWEKQALAELTQLLSSFAKLIADTDPKQAALLLYKLLNHPSSTQQSKTVAKQVLDSVDLTQKGLELIQEQAHELMLSELVENILASNPAIPNP